MVRKPCCGSAEDDAGASSQSQLLTLSLRDKFPDILVLGLFQLVRVAVKDYLSIAQNQESYPNLAALPFGQRLHAVALPVKVVSGHGEGVLQAMSDEERTGLVDISLLYDQLDNGCGRNRV